MRGKIIRLLPGHLLFSEGDPSDKIYIVREGKIEIFREREGAEIPLGYLGAHDVIGTVTLLSKKPRTASARAVTHAKVLAVDPRSLRRDLKPFPMWVQVIIKDTIARLMYVDDKLVESKLNEKRWQRKAGNQVQHAAQLLQLLVGLAKVNAGEGEPQFSVDGFLGVAEKVILQPARYLKKLHTVLVEAGIVKEMKVEGIGDCVVVSDTRALEDFADVAVQMYKNGDPLIVSQRHAEVMEALVHLAESHLDHDTWYPKELASQLASTTASENVTSMIINELVGAGAIKKVEYPPGSISLNLDALHQRKFFEKVFCQLLEIKLPE